jgi:hypothetical protein
MVRAEDQTIFGSVGAAKSAECAVCGKKLNFKDEKQKDSDLTVTQAKHCGRIYSIGQSGQATISMGRDPEYAEKENKNIEKRQKAAQARRKGDIDEANKLQKEADKESEDLAKQEDTDEPVIAAGTNKSAEQKRSRF